MQPVESCGLHDDRRIGATFAATGFIPVGATTEWLPRARTLFNPLFFWPPLRGGQKNRGNFFVADAVVAVQSVFHRREGGGDSSNESQTAGCTPLQPRLADPMFARLKQPIPHKLV